MESNTDWIVAETANGWILDNLFCVDSRNDPFASDALAAYITAMEEDGSFPDLVVDCKQKFERLYGIAFDHES